jgi:Arrestin (or S-antigen), N-terminal domain/Arrestin (or S-antigen), C-terminal domain
VYGAAHCDWTENAPERVGSGEDRRTQTKTTFFEGNEVYLNSKNFLFGSEGGNAVEMPSGVHRYNFECQLPPQLPASCEASHGNIRYSVQAVLDAPWKIDKEFKRQFTVLNDWLTDIPELKVPSQHEEVRRFCWLLCRSDPLLMTVSMPCTGYTPGQVIPVTVSYVNKSNVDVIRTKIGFKKIIRFNCSSPTKGMKMEKGKIVEVFGEGVKSGGEFTKQIAVPQLSLASNGFHKKCNVVEVFYEIKIEAEVSGCHHQNIKLTAPITICSVPPATKPVMTLPNQPAYPIAPHFMPRKRFLSSMNISNFSLTFQLHHLLKTI